MFLKRKFELKFDYTSMDEGLFYSSYNLSDIYFNLRLSYRLVCCRARTN